ncbi:type IV toxin-antitoxin system AbiEi family antitoxin domain-containing protein [Rhabdothermincola sp.]|uniref:type IV toxin-antitoxin system AbiEi family antitoxin domain-containing protein n=1 Tax=Rhabdothermincola sp. TaxID=2820405 RepID=UPI002FDFFE7B
MEVEMSLDEDLRSLAARQHCLFTTDQAQALGASRSALDHRVRTGRLHRVAPRVLCLGGVPMTTELRQWAVLLECGGTAALSHQTAAAHWGLPGYRVEPIQVLRLRDGTYPPSRLGVVHHTRSLPDEHVAILDGLRITTPARTLFDLAPHVSPGRLERLIDHAWSHRLVTGRLLDRTLRDLSRRGRPGIRIMRALLAERGPDYQPPDSALEARFEKLLREDGQAPMERQVDLGGADWLGRVDFVDHEARVIVEIDSDLHHTSISDRRADAARQAALEAAGWLVVRITEFELWHRPQEVVERVRRARASAWPRTGS